MEGKVRSVSVKKLVPSFNYEDIIDKIKNFVFDPMESEEGFLFLSEEDKAFQIKYLRKFSFTYGDYDNGYIKKTQQIIKETDFELDLGSNLLITFSGKSECNFFIRRFVSNFGSLVSPTYVDFLNIIDLFTDSKYIFRAEQIVINGFVYDQFVSGKYFAEIKDTDVFINILNKHKNKIERIKLCIEDYDGNSSIVSIYQSGRFSFNKVEDKNRDILNYLISKLLVGD